MDDKLTGIAREFGSSAGTLTALECALTRAFELGKESASHSKGLRELSPETLALVNKIKDHGQATKRLVEEVSAYVNVQYESARNLANNGDESELDRIHNATPISWASDAKHDLQTGFMKLIRAVAQPTSF